VLAYLEPDVLTTLDRLQNRYIDKPDILVACLLAVVLEGTNRLIDPKEPPKERKSATEMLASRVAKVKRVGRVVPGQGRRKL
jgi:hypothetical protein